MKISDRDKKIILVIVLLAVILLPVFLLIRPKIEDIKSLESEVASVEERYNYLKALSEKQPYYEAQIAELNKGRDALLQGYAAGITQPNIIMFLKNNIEDSIGINMTVESFSGIGETVITDGYTDESGNYVEGLTALSSTTNVSYSGDYDSVKNMLDYVFNNDEKMLISSIDMSYSAENGIISGMFSISQFAITGNGKSFNPISVPKMNHGNETIFSEIKYVEEIEEEENAEQNEVENNAGETETTEDNAE